MIIIPITRSEESRFRQMLVAYWRDLVPEASFLEDAVRAEIEFLGRYQWSGGSNNPFWALVEDNPIGFFMFRIYEDGVAAYIHDFYIEPFARRQGYGTAMYDELHSLLKELGISKIHLSVLQDNPSALNFWIRQGFEISYHRLHLVIDAEN